MKNKKNIIGILIVSLIFGCGLLLSANAVLAETSPTPTSIVDNSSNSYKTGTYGVNDFIIQAIRISRMILGFVGSLALIMFIYGGFMFLISGGSSEAVSKGKKAIIAATVGLIIVFSSYLIITFVLKSMGLTWTGAIAIPTKLKS